MAGKRSNVAQRVAAVASPLAWSAYIGLPVAGWGWLAGVPLDLLHASALALVWWTWSRDRSLKGARVLAVLAVVKIAAGGLFVDRGFAARYYSNDTWTAPAEFSIPFSGNSFTRRDDRLQFGGSAPDLPLHFFNDLRFNFFGPAMPTRALLPYSVEWNGFVHVDEAAPLAKTFYIEASEGVLGEVDVDGRAVIPLSSGLIRSEGLTMKPGWHALTVRLKAPYGAGRNFEAGEMVDGSPRPFDGMGVLLAPTGSARLALDATLRLVSSVVDLCVLLGLALLVIRAISRATRSLWHDRRVGQLLWFAAIIEALFFAWSRANGVLILTGGDDWLAYESYGRAIALGDWIGAGQGDAFYYQPLYSYFVALTHLLFGDGLFGLVLIQRLLLAATVGFVVVITRELFGPRASRIALVGGGIFLYVKVGAWTHVLLTEMLFIPLLAWWLVMLVRTQPQAASTAQAALTGVVGGLTTLTRSTVLLAWPPALLLWVASLRVRRTRMLSALLVTMMVVVSLATVRNWIVADRFVLVASSLGMNMYLGNTPAHPLAPATPERIALYDRLGIRDQLRTVTEYAVQAPREFYDGLWNKAFYTLGFFKRSQLPGADNMGTSRLYVGVWLCAVVGVLRVASGSVPGSPPTVWLPLVIALTHFVVMVIVVPFGYGDRYIIPMYPFLIPYAAFAVEGAPAALGRIGAASLSAATRARQELLRVMTGVRTHASALATFVGRHPRSWLYVAYSVSTVYWLEWNPADGTSAIDAGSALMLPPIVLAVQRLATRELVHRVVGIALWTGALLFVALHGSQSAAAVSDPLFWSVVAAVALVVSMSIRRWPIAAMIAAALAGAATMIGVLLPYLAPRGALPEQLGLLAFVCLLGLCAQALLPAVRREQMTGRIVTGVRGALLAAVVLVFMGAAPAGGGNTRIWIIALGILLGLLEAPRGRAQLRRHQRTCKP